MAQSAAERQRAYRQRRLTDGTDVRLDVMVSATTAAALQRLARHQGLSQRATLEQVLAQAEAAAIAGMHDTAGYFSVTG